MKNNTLLKERRKIMIYEETYDHASIKNAKQGEFVHNLNEALNKKHEQQKQAVRTRRNMLKKYLTETGDKNVLSIAQTTYININMLRRDLSFFKLQTKGGFIV